MPVTQIPPRESPPADHSAQRDLFQAEHWESAYRRFNPDDVPHLLIQLQDDLSRARKREALWLSVILHLFVIILLWNAERLVALLPHRALDLAVQTNGDKNKDATFLELPPDEQKLTRRPDAKAISDKDRVATSKAPQLNRDELKKLLDSQHPGMPGANVQAPPASGQPQQSQSAQNQPPTPPQQNVEQQPQPDQTAQTRTEQGPQPPPQQPRAQPNFNASMSPGSAIAQAEQAAAANKGHYGQGQAGDYGLTQGRGGPKALDQAEILTDTLGVDFGPYLTQITQIVRRNWYTLMPPAVFAPTFKEGKLAIEFAIMPDGKTMGMVVRVTSNDAGLDRAAWGSITLSNPFPPLPREFVEKCPPNTRDQKCLLGLRFYYFYNPPPGELKFP